MHIFILPQWKQHLWKSKECFWKSRSCPIRSPRSFKQFSTLRDLLSTRFRPLDGILRAISSRKIRGKKRSRKRSNWVNCSRQDSSSSSSSSREREKKDRNMDATYFAKRTKLVSTSEVDIEGRGCCCALLHASKVYRACIYERLWSLQFERTREPATIKFPSRKFSNTLIIGSLLSLYLIRNAIFVRIFGVISFPSLVCPPSFQQKLSTFAVSKKGAIKCFIVSRLILFDNFFL